MWWWEGEGGRATIERAESDLHNDNPKKDQSDKGKLRNKSESWKSDNGLIRNKGAWTRTILNK